MNIGEVRVAEDLDFERLRKLCDINDGWTLAYNHPPTTVWTKPTKDSSFHMIKVLTVYPDVPALVLYDVLHDPHYRHIWDKHMIHSIDVGFLNPNNDVSYYAISCPPPLKNRDFVLQRSWLDTGREQFVLNHSIYHHQFPPKAGFVRGLSYLTGYLIRPLPSGGCSFNYVSHSDPRGKLPPWLVNKLTHVLAPKMVKSLHKASKEYPEWKENNNPHFKPWIYPEQMTVPRISIQQCKKSSADDVQEESADETGGEESDASKRSNASSKKGREKDSSPSKVSCESEAENGQVENFLKVNREKGSFRKDVSSTGIAFRKDFHSSGTALKKCDNQSKKVSEKELKKLCEKELKKAAKEAKKIEKESKKKHK